MIKWFGCTLLLISAQALANDSTATLTAGGLRLKQTDAIAMAEEILQIRSLPEGKADADFEIVVDYLFRNVTAQPVQETIAFPMPEQPGECTQNQGDQAHFDRRSFRLTVDGQPVATRQQLQARLEGRGDITAALFKLGLTPAQLESAYASLPGSLQRKLVKAGFASAEDECNRWSTQWVYVWEQTFPPGRDLRVHHRYVPAAGGAANANYVPPDERGSGKALPPLAYPEGWQHNVASYCMGSTEQQRFRRVPAYRNVGYVLKTGANWAGPIRQFTLRIQTAQPEEKISLCWQGISKVSPTVYESVKRDFMPQQDLDILFYTPD
ncbi:DUF4424 family protein [Chitinilyticum piscinae]|uniref:DUF4424 family protein n=1 Tax=Chitinilyticum piscinae TaxID=2866724 RepID=A0A8J7FYZ5_9NEIS|nr:DUF4424 family protein [Chitinilyticum piscinae]MBE9608273.1 DUF4424 family protein [Chitinilyticum piscinae]